MKNKIYILFLILTIVFIACNSKSKNENLNPTKKEITEVTDTIVATTKVSSNIRPNQNLLLNEIYTDTIQFLKYDDDYDYKILIGKKNEQEVTIIYDWDWNLTNKFNFNKGDIIKVTWKMDSIHIDCETKDIKERAISAEIITKNKSIHFLWRENRYNEEAKQEISTLTINESFCKTISNQEKAALGYVATFIGNECDWDGAVNDDRSNLKCKILTALNLGYQCSDSHFSFLKQWFSKDESVINALEICPTIPETATIQTTFDEIILFNDDATKTITITYKVAGMNTRESKNWAYTQTDIFKYDSNNIWLSNSKKNRVVNK